MCVRKLVREEKKQKAMFFLILHRPSFGKDARSQDEVRMQAVKQKGQGHLWLSILAAKHLLKAFPRNYHICLFLSFFLRLISCSSWPGASNLSTMGGAGMLMEEGAGDCNSSETPLPPHQAACKAGKQRFWRVLNADIKFIRDGRKEPTFSGQFAQCLSGVGDAGKRNGRSGMRNGRCCFSKIRLISDPY